MAASNQASPELCFQGKGVIMRTPLVSLLTAAVVFAYGNQAALAQNKRNQNTGFEQKATAINQAATKSGGMDNLLRSISRQTGLPQDQVQALRNNHPNAGASAIALSAVMANQTKKPAETFLQSHLQGKTWESIASENHVPMQTLNQQLDQVQQALNNPQTAAASTVTAPTPTQPGASATTTGNIDQKVTALNQAVQSTGNMSAALNAISVETGVPQDQVQTLQKNHADAGAGGVLIASVLADETKQAPETFLQTHASGKSWDTIASDNKVSQDKIDLRLNHVQNAIGSAPSTPTPTGR
jgi:hypothetical protein